jgi:hypothetical protein
MLNEYNVDTTEKILEKGKKSNVCCLMATDRRQG